MPSVVLRMPLEYIQRTSSAGKVAIESGLLSMVEVFYRRQAVFGYLDVVWNIGELLEPRQTGRLLSLLRKTSNASGFWHSEELLPKAHKLLIQSPQVRLLMTLAIGKELPVKPGIYKHLLSVGPRVVPSLHDVYLTSRSTFLTSCSLSPHHFLSLPPPVQENPPFSPHFDLTLSF